MNSLHVVCFTACVAFCMAGQCSDPPDKRIYTFGFGNDFKPYEFINEKGELMGFFYDIVRRVCEISCKKCAYIVYNDYKNCWNTETMQSIALNNRYWDVCPGWVTTPQRELVYTLVGEMNNERPSSLFVKSDSDIRTFDPENHKIGLREGFRTSVACLKSKKGWDVKKVTYYPEWKTILDRVLDGTVEVGFVEEVAASSRSGLRKITDSLTCSKRGAGLMMRKDVAPDYAWFAASLKKVKASGYYKWICNIAKLAYGSDPNCIV